MKALYDKSDRDYYILFEKGEIQELLTGKEISCLLYSRHPNGLQRIEIQRKLFKVVVLETDIDVFKKNQELNKAEPKVFYDYADLIIDYGNYKLDHPVTLTLSKEWLRIGLSKELIDRCGKNEQRYSNHGAKVHFYSEDSTHFTVSQQKIVFEREELVWRREYGGV